MSISANDNVVGSPLVICTAHIHWDPEFCDVKLVQSMMLTSELQRLLTEVAEKFKISSQQTPLLICGDLNSLPNSGMLLLQHFAPPVVFVTVDDQRCVRATRSAYIRLCVCLCEHVVSGPKAV